MMKIHEALKKIDELRHLIGTTIPNKNNVIDNIIPAPKDSRFIFHCWYSEYFDV